MSKFKLFLIFITSGILIAGYTFLSLPAFSINWGDTHYVIPSDSIALFILMYYIVVSIIYLAFRNYVNFFLGILNLFFVTLPIIFMCWFNGFGEAVTLYYSTIWTTEYFTNGMIILFLTGNILFVINLISNAVRMIKTKSAIT